MTIAAKRYNNPGNVSLPIRGWKGGGKVVGLYQQSGYAEFPSVEVGLAALRHRLVTRIEDGYDTIHKLNKVYAADPRWYIGVAKYSGIAPDAPLNPRGYDFEALVYGVVRQETGDPGYFGVKKPGGLPTPTGELPVAVEKKTMPAPSQQPVTVNVVLAWAWRRLQEPSTAIGAGMIAHGVSTRDAGSIIMGLLGVLGVVLPETGSKVGK